MSSWTIRTSLSPSNSIAFVAVNMRMNASPSDGSAQSARVAGPGFNVSCVSSRDHVPVTRLQSATRVKLPSSEKLTQ